MLFAIIIGVVSMYYTQEVVEELAVEEKDKINLWATATAKLANEYTEDADVGILLDIIATNKNIPVILTDEDNNIISTLNIDSVKVLNEVYLKRVLAEMSRKFDPIEIDLGAGGRNFIYYNESRLLFQLRYYPFFQLGVITIFLIVSYVAFSFSRKYEQDFIWVGMAKETAHQLGTPISSLMAWAEVLRNMGIEEEIIIEIEKDTERLSTIADRFSKIGSNPVLEPADLCLMVQEAMIYMEKRAPTRIVFELDLPDVPIIVNLNKSLFNWVMENLTKNALDAISGKGSILVSITVHPAHVQLDFTDTGKGMSAKIAAQVFKPGITTKKRGWGLGLTLAKRIVEVYHKGRIYVKQSEPGKGTTFRLILPLAN